MHSSRSQRILIIDDEPVVRYTLQSVLEFRSLDEDEPNPDRSQMPPFDVQVCTNGEQGCAQLQQSLKEHRPFQVAFVDLYMPGHWDGLETIRRLWSLSPDLQIVLCTVLHGTTWQEVVQEVGYTDRLFILKKPFDSVEVLQLAGGLCTKWKLAQDAKRQRETLEETVQERTRELSRKNESLRLLNQDLATARDAAQAASQAKSAFLATISHELRTPMTAILGFSDILKRVPDLATDAKSHASTVHRNAEHLLRLINDILDLAKIESGKLEIEQTEFSLQTLIHELTPTFSEQATNKSLEFRIEIDSAIPGQIVSDSMRVRQILLNLLSNAFKFTHEGRIELRAEMGDGEDHLILEVSDTGIGIAAEQQEALFESFQQADNSISRQYGGTGLGLAITRNLTELLGGRVRIDSTLGEGTTFTIDLPINGQTELREVPVPLLQPAPPPNLIDPESPPEYPIRILLLEESAVLQRMMIYLFERLGATVMLVTEEAKAMEFLNASIKQQNPYDLVVFSRGNAYSEIVSFGEQCREAGYLGKLVTFLTQPLEKTEANQLAQLCDAQIEKPVNFHKLADLLQQHFSLNCNTTR